MMEGLGPASPPTSLPPCAALNEHSPENDLPATTVRSVVESFFRHKKKALALPLTILALAALVILFAPRSYVSEARLFIQLGRESVKLDPTATTGDTISMQSSNREQEIVTVTDMLQSRGIVEKVVARLTPEVVLGKSGPGKKQLNPLARAVKGAVGEVVGLLRQLDPISDHERAEVEVTENLNIEAEHDSAIVSIAYEADTPELAQLVAATVVEVYREEHMRMHRTSGSRAFFAEQRDALQIRLDEAVDRLRETKNRLNIVSIESRRETLELRLRTIEQSSNETLQLHAAAVAQIADLKQQIAAIPARVVAEQTTMPNTGADMLRSQLYALQVQMLDQQEKYSEDHPFLQATKAQLAEAEKQLAQESTQRQSTTHDTNPNYQALTLELAQAESQLAAVTGRLERIDAQRGEALAALQALNDNELVVDQLTREVDLARSNFFRHAENLEKARIDEALDAERISNVIVAQDATLNEKPTSPSKLLVGALALVLSLTSMVSVVLVAEKSSDRLSSREAVEMALELPVLGVIPRGARYAKLATH